MENNVYTLRHLTAADAFPMMRILKKVGVKDFKGCFDTEEVRKAIAEAKQKGEEVDANQIGISIALEAAQLLVERLPDCEQEIFKFLAGLSGMKEKEIAAMPFSAFGSMIIDVFKDPEFTDFFTAVSRLLR